MAILPNRKGSVARPARCFKLRSKLTLRQSDILPQSHRQSQQNKIVYLYIARTERKPEHFYKSGLIFERGLYTVIFKSNAPVLLEDKMSLSVCIARVGSLSRLRPRWTVLVSNFSTKVPRNSVYNVPVATAHPLQQNQTWILAHRCQRSMCTHNQVDSFTQLPLDDPQNGRLIYSGPLSKTIRAVKIFSLSTSGLSLCLQPLILMKTAETSLLLKIAFGSFFSFFIVLTPLLIHMVAKKYVTGVYFEPDSRTFTAFKYSFFCRTMNMKFTAEDVKIPEVAGPFTSLIVKGTALFMDPKFFLDKNAYIHLMGFDKPLDWELPKSDVNESPKK